jgi:hypothetical protein
MKVIVYQYRSPIGTFMIISDNGNWELYFGDDLRGTFQSALAATSMALTTVAGEFDSSALEEVDVPTDINKWEIVG